MDGRPTWTDCDEAEDYVVSNVLSSRDLVFRPDNMKETVPHKSMGFFFKRSRAANSVVRGQNWPNFELIQALMHIIVTCKYEKNPIINIRENVMTPFSPLSLYGSYLLPWKQEF